MITSHVLDTTRGRPASGVGVRLERMDRGQWASVGRGETDADGRVKNLLPPNEPMTAGVYRLTFNTGGYFDHLGVRAFYQEVVVVFETSPTEAHYHIPLLLSPFGYTTYRGS